MNAFIRQKGGKTLRAEDPKEFKLTDNNIQEVIDESISQWDDDYAQLYMTRMSPEDFLNLTATENAMAMIERDKFDLDIGILENKRVVADMIYLDIDIENKQVRGHEGRHRMYALKNAGYNKVDVVVFASNYDKYHAPELSNVDIKGQEALNYKSAHFDKLVPVSKANVDRIKKRDY